MKPKRVIMLADCQSFYASVEKSLHPEHRNKPLVVSGDPERRSGIILAACPLAKSYGITTAERLGEALAKCPHVVVMKPSMQRYIDFSLRITAIYEQYSDLVEPYSIDEQFIDVSGSLKLFGNPYEIAKQIQDQVMQEIGVRVRVGIGENKILAKTACDNFAKKNESGIYELKKDNLNSTLWPLSIDKMFMIGGRMTQHCLMMGIRTIGDLAQLPLGQVKQLMRSRFGRNSDIQAELLWRIANGIDDSPVSPNTHNQAQKGIGHMMTLPRDYYNIKEIHVVLLELCDLVCQRCRAKRVMGQVVSAFCQGADFDRPTGFSRQRKMPDATSSGLVMFETVKDLFAEYWDGLPVRRVGVSITDLQPDDTIQLSLFDDLDRRITLDKTMDFIRERFGQTSIFRASSATDAGQVKNRSKMIGGHLK